MPNIIGLIVLVAIAAFMIWIGARALQAHVLPQDEFKRSGQCGLDCGETDLAIALQRVAIAS